ncbi:uncharacterized protein LOC111192758 [Astyanax mexicanus]|uniref:uncharacterized protein LOC111192758 n=1 Tax=Astyanax mexicanus TaxID=7994 RepID=UPI0020CB3DC0|nr:uncharacterized protein LOC111192758 [Astyanax mexicanus]XP_049323128.1 uncharacterized protein LOC111192758 [Astyanax mexicanus]
MDPRWRSRPLPIVAQSGNFCFRTCRVSPWQGEDPAACEEPQPCQPGFLEMKPRAHIKKCTEGQLEGLLPTSHPESPLPSTTPERDDCKALVVVAEAEPLNTLNTAGPVAQCEEARITSLTTTHHPETFSQSGIDVLVVVAEAGPSHRLDTNSTEPESEPVPVAQAEEDLESSVEVVVESIETAPKNKRRRLQRCLRLWRSTASTFLSCFPCRVKRSNKNREDK